MKYYDENGKDKLAAIQVHDKDATEVLRVQSDGEVIWQGRKVESDDQFKAAMIAMADALKDGMRRSPLVRLADEEINKLIDQSILQYAGRTWKEGIKGFAELIMKAMIKKNGG